MFLVTFSISLMLINVFKFSIYHEKLAIISGLSIYYKNTFTQYSHIILLMSFIPVLFLLFHPLADIHLLSYTFIDTAKGLPFHRSSQIINFHFYLSFLLFFSILLFSVLSSLTLGPKTITVVPPYPPGISSKTLSGCMKTQIVPNHIYTMFFFLNL